MAPCGQHGRVTQVGAGRVQESERGVWAYRAWRAHQQAVPPGGQSGRAAQVGAGGVQQRERLRLAHQDGQRPLQQ